jgi:hypothetical protein
LLSLLDRPRRHFRFLPKEPRSAYGRLMYPRNQKERRKGEREG